MTRDEKYSDDKCGMNRYNGTTTIAAIIRDEFERRVGRWQLDALHNQFPVRQGSIPEHDLVELIETFDLATSENDKLREAATKLLAAHKPTEMKGMLVKFSDNTPHPEDLHSYRHYELLIFGDGNYVGVLTRKSWTALTEDKVVHDANGEPEMNENEEYVIRAEVQGEPYEKGVSPWCVRTYHDSCWRDAIDKFCMQTPHLGSLDYLFFDWYQLFVVTEGDGVWKALRNRNALKPWHFDEDHNYIGEKSDDAPD